MTLRKFRSMMTNVNSVANTAIDILCVVGVQFFECLLFLAVLLPMHNVGIDFGKDEHRVVGQADLTLPNCLDRCWAYLKFPFSQKTKRDKNLYLQTIQSV